MSVFFVSFSRIKKSDKSEESEVLDEVVVDSVESLDEQGIYLSFSVMLSAVRLVFEVGIFVRFVLSLFFVITLFDVFCFMFEI